MREWNGKVSRACSDVQEGRAGFDNGYDPVKNLSWIAGVLESLVIDPVSPPELIIGDLLLSKIVQITGLSDEAPPLIGPKAHQALFTDRRLSELNIPQMLADFTILGAPIL